MTFDVKVVARASRDAIMGVEGDRLKVALSAAPVEGEANRALVALLAARLGVPKRSVEIVRGEKSRHKTVQVAGIGRESIEKLREA